MQVTCPNCRKTYTPELLQQPDAQVKLMQWKSGTLIQRVWPQATPAQREQLITGMCSDKCWNEFLGPED